MEDSFGSSHLEGELLVAEAMPTPVWFLHKQGPAVDSVELVLTLLIDSGELRSMSLGLRHHRHFRPAVSLISSTSMTFNGDAREGGGREKVWDFRGVVP